MITLKKLLSKMPVPSDEKILLGRQDAFLFVYGFAITNKGIYCRSSAYGDKIGFLKNYFILISN